MKLSMSSANTICDFLSGRLPAATAVGEVHDLIFGPPFSMNGVLSVCLSSVTTWYRFETVQRSGLKFYRVVGQGLGPYSAERHPKKTVPFPSSGGYSGGTLRFASTEIGYQPGLFSILSQEGRIGQQK